MNTETRMNTQTRTVQSHKKNYTRPRLITYGKVRSLTQSGSLAVLEVSNVLGKPSERRIKENIVRVGDHPLGIGLYLFDYKPQYREQWGHGRQFGVMADEVETVIPEAVCMHPDGYKMVNYAMLGIKHAVH